MSDTIESAPEALAERELRGLGLTQDAAARDEMVVQDDEVLEASAWDALLEGDVVAEKYRVGGVVRRTGQLLTVSARHVELDQPVSLTLLGLEAAAEPGLCERFLTQARAIARVPSRYAAKLLDAGRLQHGAPYAIVEEPPGFTLADVARVRGAMPAPEAVSYVLQICRSLASVHALGVTRVHLSTASVHFTRDFDNTPALRVVLLGAASAPPSEVLREEVTRAQSFDPTTSLLPYVAPEDLDNAGQNRDDERAVVWAIGTILFELVTGVAAFRANTPAATIARILSDAPPQPDKYRPDLAPGLSELIARCLEKTPSARLATVAELGTLLEPFSEGFSNTEAYLAPSRRKSSVPPPLPEVSQAPYSAPAAPIAGATELRAPRSSRLPTLESLAGKTRRSSDKIVGLAVGIALGIVSLAAAEAAFSAKAPDEVSLQRAVSAARAATSTSHDTTRLAER